MSMQTSSHSIPCPTLPATPVLSVPALPSLLSSRLRELVGKDSPLSHFRVEFLNHAGTLLEGARIYTFDCRAQSPCVSIVPFSSKGELLVERREWPLLKIRSHIQACEPISEDGTFLSLPGEILTHEARTTLGHRFFPSVGGTTEFAVLKLKPFSGERAPHLQLLSPQAIIDGFQEGTVRDLRLVLAAFRFARHSGQSLVWKTPLSFSHNYQDYRGIVPLRTLSHALSWLHSTPAPDRVAQLRIAHSEAPMQPFLRAMQYGEHIASVRRGVDAVDVAAACLIGGIPHLVVKREVRPALVAAQLSLQQSEITAHAISLGGVAESLEGEQTLAQIGLRAIQGVREEVGCEVRGIPVYFGHSYPSPLHSPERAYHFGVEIDPDTLSDQVPDIDEVVDLSLMAAEDVLALSDRDLLQDPRLELSAHILRAMMPISQKV